MKRTENLKKTISGTAFLITAAMFMASCNNSGTAYKDNRKADDPKEIAEDANDVVLATNEKKDAQFLVEAAEINLEEIELGQLAQTKSTDPEVKRVGKMMVKDHTRSLNEIKELALKKGITIPTTLTKDGQKAYDKFIEKDEKDFNQDYCDKMVRGHKEAINKFENASKNAEDYEIKAWAAASLPSLRTHLNHADICRELEKDKKTTAGLK